MTLIIVVVFISVFVILALILAAGGSGASEKNKQTLAILNAALASEQSDSTDYMVDVRKAELFSAVPWVNRWLLKIEFAPRLRSILYQANLKWTVGTLLLMSAVSCFLPAYVVNLRVHTFFIAAVIGAVTGSLPLLFVLKKRGMRFGKFESGMPEAIDLMVSALRAGHSLVSALGLMAAESPDPIGPEFRICFEEQNYGLELRTALQNLVSRVPLQDLRIVVTAILIQKECGGNLAEVLDNTSQIIRERFRLRREIRTYTAQGRLTGWILSLLPLVLGIALYTISPDNLSLLWKREIGIKLLWASGIMTIIGAGIINKIVNIDV